VLFVNRKRVHFLSERKKVLLWQTQAVAEVIAGTFVCQVQRRRVQ
jgi:hypothetical protein